MDLIGYNRVKNGFLFNEHLNKGLRKTFSNLPFFPSKQKSTDTNRHSNKNFISLREVPSTIDD